MISLIVLNAEIFVLKMRGRDTGTVQWTRTDAYPVLCQHPHHVCTTVGVEASAISERLPCPTYRISRATQSNTEFPCNTCRHRAVPCRADGDAGQLPDGGEQAENAAAQRHSYGRGQDGHVRLLDRHRTTRRGAFSLEGTERVFW